MVPFPVGILLSFNIFCAFFFLCYSKINKFITTAITFAHLTLASIWKKIWEACEILNLKHGSISCWYSFCHSFFFSVIPRSNKFITTAIFFAHLTLASIWKKIWEACEILNLKHGSISCWYSVVFFFSLLFQDQQIYYNGNNFCAFDASFDLKKDLRSLWNSEPKTWFHFLLVFFCHSFFSLLFQDKQIYYNGNNFCAFDASFDLKKDLRSLWNSEPKTWFHFLLVFCCHSFFSLLFQDQQIYYNGNNFCAFDASFDLKKDLRSLWNSEPKTWFHFLLVFCCHSFFSLLFQDQQIYYNGNNFCAFDASFDLKKDLRSLWNSEPKTWFHFLLVFCCHFFFSLLFQDQQIYYNGNNFCAFDASFDLKKDLRSLWNSEPKTWFHFLLVFFCHSFFSLLFQDQQIYYNGNIFCAFDASFDLKKDLRSLWNSEPKTWFHFLLVFCCHFFFLYYSKINKFITTAIFFAHLTLASIWKKIWEACEILNLKHGSISCWYSVVILFFLYYSKINKFITTAITFAHLTLASIWKKIWEACEILNLKHGSISCWYSVVILFFLYYSKINKFITKAIFCAFDASFDLKKDLRSLWNSEPISCCTNGSISCWYSVVISFFFLYYSKINKFITTAIFFAHLTLASIWKKIWEACEILNLKHGSISCWYSVVILFFLYYSKINKFITTAITFAHLTLASIWKKIWEACEILNLKHGSISCWYSVVFFFFSIIPRSTNLLQRLITFAHLTLASIWKKIWEACEILNLKHGSISCWYSFVILFFLYYSKINKFITTAIFFAHLTLASIWKKIWEACEILNLKHGSISCWYSVVILFFLYYSKINKFITTAITFAHLTLASIWKKIWEACEILNLKHGSISCWYSVVILFFSLLFQDQQIYYNGNNFCAFDASFDLKKDLRSLWNSEPKTWFHFLLVFCCHSFFFSIIPRSTNLLQRQ